MAQIGDGLPMFVVHNIGHLLGTVGKEECKLLESDVMAELQGFIRRVLAVCLDDASSYTVL